MSDTIISQLASILRKSQGAVCAETSEEIDIGGEVVSIRWQYDELRKDRKRLEWLVCNGARILLSYKTFYVEIGGLAVAMDKTWRDAIDAAMEGEG